MRSTLKDILVPIDFKKASFNALDLACEIAQKINGQIHLLYVIKKLDFISEMFRSNDEIVRITEEAKVKLDELAKKYKEEKQLTFFSKVEMGNVYDEILAYSKKIRSRFIIMGDNHDANQVNSIISTNVAQVVGEAVCPVITVKNTKREIFNKMLVPLDLSKETSKQVFSAIAFGLHYNASIHLVSVVIGGIKINQSRIFSKLKKVKKTVEENGVTCTAHIYKRSDVPIVKRVLEYREQIDADIIMLMTHQEKNRSDNYIGAVAQQIINESPVPVISITNTASTTDVDEVVKEVVDPLRIIYD